MTEDNARGWLRAAFGDEAIARLGAFAELVLQENERQNLISPTTTNEVWNRHILDSAQLVPLAEGAPGCWLDIGTGAGFPGMVVAILRPEEILLVEPRRRRAEFLISVVRDLALAHVAVIPWPVERIDRTAAIISARAVAGLDRLFSVAQKCATAATVWLLPRGRSANADVLDAGRRWSGMFHVEQSLSDESAGIVIARQVRPR